MVALNKELQNWTELNSLKYIESIFPYFISETLHQKFLGNRFSSILTMWRLNSPRLRNYKHNIIYQIKLIYNAPHEGPNM